MNKEELRKIVAIELKVEEKDLIWSEKCANPKTIYKNEELGTVAFKKLGYWVLKTKSI